MDIMSILKTVGEHWALFVFVFGLGAAWWQGKSWFKNLNSNIEECIEQHKLQGVALDDLDRKLDGIDGRMSRLEDAVELMHGELRDQEVKLTVLEHITERQTKKSAAR